MSYLSCRILLRAARMNMTAVWWVEVLMLPGCWMEVLLCRMEVLLMPFSWVGVLACWLEVLLLPLSWVEVLLPCSGPVTGTISSYHLKCPPLYGSRSCAKTLMLGAWVSKELVNVGPYDQAYKLDNLLYSDDAVLAKYISNFSSLPLLVNCLQLSP